MMRVALATAGALVAASVVFVALVLPAEFGIDPTGVGRALGLTGLSGAEARRGHEPVAGALVIDRRDFELAPFESVELKYDLEAGRGIVYSWTASAEVVFDLHGEPADAAPDYAESFAQGRAAADSGVYHASFSGIHGWFWENRGALPVLVRLRVAGFPNGATLYGDGVPQQLSLADPLE